jgi:hypothetical protein
MKPRPARALAGLAFLLSGCVSTPIEVDPSIIRAHQLYLGSADLRGRVGASADEAVAAAYVAARFKDYGLTPAPNSTSFLQTLEVPPTPMTRQLGIADHAETRNVIGFLSGTDAGAGYLLISAHLDGLGAVDGKVHPGANDNASGMTAVLELARLLARSGPHKRGILFVIYGTEEPGAVGSRYFANHPPVPLDEIVANIGFEMIGARDPNLPSGLALTGFERSELGAMLRAHGAPLFPDPRPDQRYFERSDNYQLALKGVVAHTVSGWLAPPNYHQPSDSNAKLDFAFMARTIQSLVGPIRWLASSDARPQWKPGRQPNLQPR